MIASIGRRIGRRGLSGVMGGRRRALVPPVMTAGQPDVVLSAANAPTSIVGAMEYDSVESDTVNPIFAISGGHPSVSGGALVAGHAPGATFVTPSLGYNIVFDGDVIEFRVSGAGWQYRLFVNGKLEQADPRPGPSSDGNQYRVRFTFPTRATRALRFETVNPFLGIAVGPTDDVQAGVVTKPRTIIIGDSFTEGPGNERQGYAGLLEYMLDWDVWISGSGGTGYIRDKVDSGRVNIEDRLGTDLLPWSPEIVVFAAGINDMDFDASDVGAAAGRCYAAVRDNLPDAELIVISPFWKNEFPTYAMWRVADAIKAAALAAGATYIDLLRPILWTGTGNEGAPTGSGTSDLYVASDGTHATLAGHRAIADRIKRIYRNPSFVPAPYDYGTDADTFVQAMRAHTPERLFIADFETWEDGGYTFAPADGDRVLVWRDVSGKGDEVSLDSGSSKLSATINSTRDAVGFSASSGFTPVAFAGDFELNLVARHAWTGQADRPIVGTLSGVNSYVQFHVFGGQNYVAARVPDGFHGPIDTAVDISTGWHLITVRRVGAALAVLVDGAQIYSSTSNTGGTVQLDRLAGHTGTSTTPDIALVMLTSAETAAAATIKTHYGIL